LLLLFKVDFFWPLNSNAIVEEANRLKNTLSMLKICLLPAIGSAVCVEEDASRQVQISDETFSLVRMKRQLISIS